MIVVLAALMTFHQVERLWIHAGGAQNLAPTMAAVAVAESHPIGDAHHARMALENLDRHELGGSFCGFQIQRAHTEGYAVGEPGWNRDRLLREPLYCARAAVYVQRHFGLDAWTTHQDGSFLAFVEREEAHPPAPDLTPIPERRPNLAAMLRTAREREVFHLAHPRRYTAFVPPPEPAHEVSPGEKIALGFIAVGIVCYSRRALRAARDADAAYRRRTRRRRWEGRPLRHRTA